MVSTFETVRRVGGGPLVGLSRGRLEIERLCLGEAALEQTSPDRP
jgi:hypothetical protein